jgi:hypothetical protein
MLTRDELIKEIEEIEKLPMSWTNLERFVLLHKAKKYLCYEKHREKFDEQTAHKWVKSMYPGGEHWTMEQTTGVLKQKGYHHKPEEWYAIMNSLYSDYGRTMMKYNADKVDVWADLAHDWLDDGDAVEDKTEEYYEYIVKH